MCCLAQCRAVTIRVPAWGSRMAAAAHDPALALAGTLLLSASPSVSMARVLGITKGNEPSDFTSEAKAASVGAAVAASATRSAQIELADRWLDMGALHSS